jgi:hypothetical protein
VHVDRIRFSELQGSGGPHLAPLRQYCSAAVPHETELPNRTTLLCGFGDQKNNAQRQSVLPHNRAFAARKTIGAKQQSEGGR